jgi:hypothetical protein
MRKALPSGQTSPSRPISGRWTSWAGSNRSDALLAGSERIDLGVGLVTTIGLDDLIKVKRHINRSKDQAALVQLEALKQLRDGS